VVARFQGAHTEVAPHQAAIQPLQEALQVLPSAVVEVAHPDLPPEVVAPVVADADAKFTWITEIAMIKSKK